MVAELAKNAMLAARICGRQVGGRNPGKERRREAQARGVRGLGLAFNKNFESHITSKVFPKSFRKVIDIFCDPHFFEPKNLTFWHDPLWDPRVFGFRGALRGGGAARGGQQVQGQEEAQVGSGGGAPLRRAAKGKRSFMEVLWMFWIVI